VINGKAEVGKDTLCDFIIGNYFAEKISSIDPIIEIALNTTDWDGVKNKKSRKFLSDLKRAYISFNDLPNVYLIKKYNEFLKNNNDILFIHIRESDQIDDFLKKIEGTCCSTTLLIKSKKKRKPVFFGNDSDDYVDNYQYGYEYNNIQPLEKAEEDFMGFFQKLLEAENISFNKKHDKL